MKNPQLINKGINKQYKDVQIPLKVGLKKPNQQQNLQVIQIRSDNIQLKVVLSNTNNQIENQFKKVFKEHLQSKINCKIVQSQGKSFTISNIYIGQKDNINQNTFLIKCSKSGNQDNYLQNNRILGQFKNSFRLTLSMSSLRQSLKLKIQQQNISFFLERLQSVKFIKNQTLLNLLKDSKCFNELNKKQNGVMTMDHQQRMLLLEQQTNYPIVGLWSKQSRNQSQLVQYQLLKSYINAKFVKKCYFKSNEKKYFYYVNLKAGDKSPTVYLVRWQVNQPIFKQKILSNWKNWSDSKFICSSNIDNEQLINILNQQQSSNNDNIFLKQSFGIGQQEEQNDFTNWQQQTQQKSNSQNGMNFTLRDKKKSESESEQLQTLQSLINYSYISPIKQLTPESQKLKGINSNQLLEQSPQFSTFTKNNLLQSECIDLKSKVYQQQLQITKLKAIIMEMQSQLKVYKNSRISTTHCDSNEHLRVKNNRYLGTQGSCSPQINQFLINSQSQSQASLEHQILSNASSPKQIRRLRQSDLKSNSVSSSSVGSWLKNSSNKKDLRSHCLIDSEIIANDKFKLLSEKLAQERQKVNYLNHDNLKVPSPIQFGQMQIIGSTAKKGGAVLPLIQEEDNRDPWEYMEIVEN